MKKKLLLLLCFLLLCGCSFSPKEKALEVWASEDCPLVSSLSGEAVSLRLFPDEAALLEALQTKKPTLMLCSHLGYEAVSADVRRMTVPYLPKFNDEILAAFPTAGSDFFPLGSDCLVVSAEPGLTTAPNSLQDLLSLPSLSVFSFSSLFCQELLLAGREFHADREKDRWEESFSACWNALAVAAYRGSIFRDSAPCAVALSTALPEGTRDLFLYPGSEKGCVSNCYGFVSFTGGNAEIDFLQGLYMNDHAASLALDSGLIPAVRNTLTASSPLSGLLLRLQKAGAPRYPSLETDYVRNRDRFEQEFRSVLVSLSPERF